MPCCAVLCDPVLCCAVLQPLINEMAVDPLAVLGPGFVSAYSVQDVLVLATTAPPQAPIFVVLAPPPTPPPSE